jgi:hypothetical protein
MEIIELEENTDSKTNYRNESEQKLWVLTGSPALITNKGTWYDITIKVPDFMNSATFYTIDNIVVIKTNNDSMRLSKLDHWQKTIMDNAELTAPEKCILLTWLNQQYPLGLKLYSDTIKYQTTGNTVNNDGELVFY